MKMTSFSYKALLAIFLCISSFIIGKYSSSPTKDYQAACMLSDICHFALDNCEEFDEIYYDYIDNIDTDPKAIITKEEIQNYYWLY